MFFGLGNKLYDHSTPHPLPCNALFSLLDSQLLEVSGCVMFCVIMCLVVSDSLQPRGLQPTRLFCPWGFSRQECWSGLSCPPPGESSQPRDRTQVSCIAGRFFTVWATREAHVIILRTWYEVNEMQYIFELLPCAIHSFSILAHLFFHLLQPRFVISKPLPLCFSFFIAASQNVNSKSVQLYKFFILISQLLVGHGEKKIIKPRRLVPC